MSHYTLLVVQNSSAARATVDVGTVIADTYTIEALIGRGGMGSVFLASHNRLPGKKVAIKMLHPDLVDDEVLARFKREAQIATQLDHPNIVRVDDFLTLADGTPCMLLEYLQGETLAQRLRAGPLELEHALSIVRQIGSALSAAHRAGIVHRDLKPQNIFLVPTEHDGHAIEVAKVLDFGISKIRGSQTVKTQESSLLGTPQYMAPEQATGQHTAVDERTDVFAFGAIVYEMLAGQPAFQGASIPEVVFKVVYEQPTPLTTLATTVPTTVTDAISHAMEKQADKRFANVNAFIEALTGQPISVFRKKVPLPETKLADGTRAGASAAFAATMGSGDHKDAIVPLPVVNAMAATVDSQSRGRTLSAPPPIADDPAVTTKDKARRSPLVVPAIALGGAVIAGAIVFLALRGSPDKPTPPPIADQQSKDVIAPVVTDAGAVAQVAPSDAPAVAQIAPSDAPAVAHVVASDAAVVAHVVAGDAAVVAHVATDAGAAKVAAPDTKTYADEIEVKGLLAEVEASFKSGDCETARRGALLVTRKPNPRPDQRITAYGVIGACSCSLESDQSGANAAYRGTPDGTPAARRIIAACKTVNITPFR